MTIDTTLPANNPLRFRNNLLPSYKNDGNWSDQNLGQKNMQNEAEYDLDRKAAKYLHFLLITWTSMNIWMVKI